jgi:hypothetical protein
MRRLLLVIVSIGALIGASLPAGALQYGAWHLITLPNNQLDVVRVAHVSTGTYCDFLVHDRLDQKLIGIGLPYRACVPGEE